MAREIKISAVTGLRMDIHDAQYIDQRLFDVVVSMSVKAAYTIRSAGFIQDAS